MEKLVKHLTQKLQEPLPGRSAHQTMTSISRHELQEPDNVRLSAVMILLFPSEHQIFFPLIRRQQYKGVHSGQIALPGGKFDESDNTLIYTALRECKEEIGVSVPIEQVLGTLTPVYIPPSNMRVLPVVAYMHEVPNYFPDNHEVAGVINANLSQLQAPETKSEQLISLPNGAQLRAPSFVLGQDIIWGATAMIINELLAII